jgi:hypothetical protein
MTLLQINGLGGTILDNCSSNNSYQRNTDKRYSQKRQITFLAIASPKPAQPSRQIVHVAIHHRHNHQG